MTRQAVRPASVMTLYLAEMRTLPRGRFALGGAALVAGLLLFLATVIGTGPGNGLMGFSIFAYGFMPAAFAALAVALVAGPRVTRFSHSLFTSPVTKGRLLIAKALAALTVALLYLAMTLPFLGVAAWRLDLPDYVGSFLAMGAGVLLYAVALGTFLGVAFTGRSLAAPMGLAAGALALSVLAVPFLVDLERQPGETPFLAALLHASPHVLLADAGGLLRGSGMEAERPALALAIFLAEVAALFALAGWTYLREQGVEGWECPPRRRVLVALAAALVVAAPTVAAEASYRPYEQEPPHLPLPDNGRNASLFLVEPGAPAPARFGDFFAGTWDAPLPAGEAARRDLLVLLPVAPERGLRVIDVALEGGEGTRASVLDGEIQVAGAAPAPLTPIGRPPGWPEQAAYVRVPVEITVEGARSFGGIMRVLHLVVTYTVEGEETPTVAHVQVPVRADVPHAGLQLALAGAPALVGLAGAALHRRLRVG